MTASLIATAKITKRRGLRNLTLRVCPRTSQLKLTVPWRTSQKAINAFVTEHIEWINTQQAKARPAQMVAHGASILWHGQNYVLHHHATTRGVDIVLDDAAQILHVHCPEPRLLRAVQRFYQQQALLALTELAHTKFTLLNKIGVVPPKGGISSVFKAHINHLGDPRLRGDDGEIRPIAQITVRDTTSRWGSCTSSGKLSFSWRLIMAPSVVQDYVVAHEVAHLAHFNHSDAFWACCQSLSADMSAAKIWIRRHGANLQNAWVAPDNIPN